MNLKVMNFSGIPFAFFQVALIISTWCFSPKFEHLFSTEASVARTVMLHTHSLTCSRMVKKFFYRFEDLAFVQANT